MVVVALVVAAVELTPVVRQLIAHDLATSAAITASSTAIGSSADSLADDPKGGGSGGAGWTSRDEGVGAWVEFRWPRTQTVSMIELTVSADPAKRIRAGFLSFDDGSSLEVTLPATKLLSTIDFTARDVTSVRFTVTGVRSGATVAGIDEVRLYSDPTGPVVSTGGGTGGNVAALATASVSDPSSNGSADSAALTDSPDPRTSGIGSQWVVTKHPVGEWARLEWSSPRQLAGVQLFGASRAEDTVASGSIVFSDGSTVPFGQLLGDAHRPTTVSFTPRVTTSLRIVIDAVSGNGSVGIGEIGAYETGSTPPSLTASTSVHAALATSGCDSGRSVKKPGTGMSLVCPLTNSSLTGTTKITVLAPGMTKVDAQIWSAGSGSSVTASAVTSGTVDTSTGRARVTVDLDRARGGPVTVRVRGYQGGASTPDDSATLYLQFYNLGGTSAAHASKSPTAPARGMTLAYDEEFTSELSLSRTGAGADYAAAKPTWHGVEEFGSASFADPALGLDNVTNTSDGYLRITLSPTPGDATGSGSKHAYVGGLLASARVGGSGFSAQYGYFEARMLVPAAPGTWPAFWTLPSTLAIAKPKSYAEIDAMEAYGHDPYGNCQATHVWTDGKDTANVQCSRKFSSRESASAWHTYGVRVGPTENVYYIDGKEVATAPQVAGADEPMYFMVNLALGGGWPVDLDNVGNAAALYVDYIRVYT